MSSTVFAHGSGNKQWGAVPWNTVNHSDDARRIRDQYFNSDDGMMTMALAIRGTQFSTEEVARQAWALARELGLRVTVRVGDGELGKTRGAARRRWPAAGRQRLARGESGERRGRCARIAESGH